MESAQVLSYSITEKGMFQVVVFNGKLTQDSEEVLQGCAADILGRDASKVILSFQGVNPNIERPAYRHMARLQKILRDNDKAIRVAGLNVEVGFQLVDHAILRQEEIFMSLSEAIESFLPRQRGLVRVFSERRRKTAR